MKTRADAAVLADYFVLAHKSVNRGFFFASGYGRKEHQGRFSAGARPVSPKFDCLKVAQVQTVIITLSVGIGKMNVQFCTLKLNPVM